MDDLEPGWLSIELSSAEEEIATWGEGLRDSFHSSSSEADPQGNLQEVKAG